METTTIIEKYKDELMTNGSTRITEYKSTKDNVRLFEKVLASLSVATDRIVARLNDCSIILL